MHPDHIIWHSEKLGGDILIHRHWLDSLVDIKRRWERSEFVPTERMVWDWENHRWMPREDDPYEQVRRNAN